MGHQTEYEETKLFSETPERLTAALPLVLKTLGWGNFDICGFGVTAQMSQTEVSPANCLTAVLTCIPHGYNETELRLTVCSHQGVLSKEKAISILNEVGHYLTAHKPGG